VCYEQSGSVQDTAGRQPVRRAGDSAGPRRARARDGHVQHQPGPPRQEVSVRLRLRRAPAVQLPQHAHQDRPSREDGQELVRGGLRAVGAILRAAPRRRGGGRRLVLLLMIIVPPLRTGTIDVANDSKLWQAWQYRW
jgi:hypothetical protein